MIDPRLGEGERQAVHDLMARLTGVFDPVAVGRQAAAVLARHLRLHLTSVALADHATDEYAMCGTIGARGVKFAEIRLRPGQGLGGRAVESRELFASEEYRSDPRISDHFRAIVSEEDLHSMAAAPVVVGGLPVAILYGARREAGRLPDRSLDILDTSAAVLAPVLAAAMQAQERVRMQVSEERQRIADGLHDDVAQLLFSISAAARRARDLVTSPADQSVIVDRIASQAQQAADALRSVLTDLAPVAPLETLPAVMERDVQDFADRSGIPACLILRGSPVSLPGPVERALVAALRQVLFNVEQHADATTVVVTLRYRPSYVDLVVQDDGRGLDSGFQVPIAASGPRHRGLVSVYRQVEQVGGLVELRPVEDGGTRFHLRVPRSR